MKTHSKLFIRLLMVLLLILGLPMQAIAAQQSIDAVIAIVEEDIITRRELDERKRLILIDFSKS